MTETLHPARPRPLGLLAAVVRGALGLTGLAGALVGIPAALVVVVGWPLPTERPDPGDVLDALQHGGVTEATLVKALACVVWVAWLPLGLAVVRELAARAGAARRWPVGRVGPLQRLASELVASVGLLASLAASARPATAAPLAEVLAPLVAHPSAAAASTAPPAPTAAPGPAAPARPSAPAAARTDLVTYRVQPRDTLWGIAERVLGAGERWRELAELNDGRTVAPGVVFRAATERLQPGWSLLVPGEADGADHQAGGPVGRDEPVAEEVEVAPGDTLWGLAERLYGDPGRWRELWEANAGRRFGDRVLRDPSRIHPGWRLVVPGRPAEPAPERAAPAAPSGSPAAPAPPPVTTVTAPPPAPATSPTTVAPRATALPCPVITPAEVAPEVPDADDEPTPVRPADAPFGAVAGLRVPGAAAALIATGAAAAVATRRRRRARQAAAGHRLPAPDPDLAPTRAALAGARRPVALARLEVALRHLAAAVARSTSPAVRVLAVVLADDGAVGVVVDGAVAPAPFPWRPGPTADRLVLPPDVALTVLAADVAGVAPPCPALAHLGRADEGEVFVDLEAVGVLALDGPEAAALDVARAVLAGLAVSPLASVLDVVACGVEPWGLEQTRVRSVDEGAVVDVATSAAAPVRAALAAAGMPSTFALRAGPGDGGTGDEAWEPLVLVAGRLQPATTQALRPLAGVGLGVATVGGESRWRLGPVPGGRWRLEPLGIDLTPATLGAEELADLGAVLRDADRPAEPITETAEPVAQPAERSALDPEPVAEATTATVTAPVVRVLGPVDVVDGAGEPVPFERAKSLELLVWLVLHRRRPLRRDARAALWSVEVADGTFHNVASEARRALTRAVPPPTGEEWLPRTPGERFALHPAITTDLDHFRGLVAAGRPRDALALVRGVPFAGAEWWWLDAEAHAVDLTLEVVDVAADVADAALADGRLDDVFAVTALGLQLLPGHDRLVAARLRAHAAAGNPAGLRREAEAYERVVAGEGVDPSPAILHLRAELARTLASRLPAATS